MRAFVPGGKVEPPMHPVRPYMYWVGASPGTNVAHLYRGVSPAVTNVAMAHLYRMEIHPGINVSIFFIGV
jgi:hypothetical protein